MTPDSRRKTQDAGRTTPYNADLHIHTLLSPCGEIEMIPPLIVEAAKVAGLDVIAIADHNSCENAAAVMRAAEGSGIRVLPGMEVQSVEGIHLLCLFDEIEQAEALQEAVYGSLISLPGGAYRYSEEQFVVDWEGEFVKYCEKRIALPTSMDIDEVFERVAKIGGIMIPSHIDRQGTGIIDILGMIPETPDINGLEISRNITPDEARVRFPSVGNRPIFQNSDAHWLSAIGERHTILHMAHRNVSEIKLACRGVGGRRVENA
ncbi:MAG: PHP domain-containing protein [Armatimonadota bacterium]|nr:PHP domain-containing protein [bacterium]